MDVHKVMKHEALIALVLSGFPVSRELADLLVAGSAEYTEPKAALFTRPLVAGELETIHAEQLDEES